MNSPANSAFLTQDSWTVKAPKSSSPEPYPASSESEPHAATVSAAAESTAANEPVILRDEIEAVGGRIAGVVVNRSTYTPPAFLRRLTG